MWEPAESGKPLVNLSGGCEEKEPAYGMEMWVLKVAESGLQLRWWDRCLLEPFEIQGLRGFCSHITFSSLGAALASNLCPSRTLGGVGGGGGKYDNDNYKSGGSYSSESFGELRTSSSQCLCLLPIFLNPFMVKDHIIVSIPPARSQKIVSHSPSLTLYLAPILWVLPLHKTFNYFSLPSSYCCHLNAGVTNIVSCLDHCRWPPHL